MKKRENRNPAGTERELPGERDVKPERTRFFTTRNLTVTAVLTAISYILYMFVKFPIPFIFPNFLEIQFSDMPALLGGFMMGPVSGCVIILVKCLLKMPFTTTVCVGEIGDILIGFAFVLPAALLYKKFRTKKGAIVSLTLGTVCATGAAMLSNAFLLIPFYAKQFGWDAVVGMLTSLFPSVGRQSFYLYYLPLSVLPFNLLRCAVCALVTFLVYKGTQRLVNGMFAPRKKAAPDASGPSPEQESGIRPERGTGSGQSRARVTEQTARGNPEEADEP